MSARVAETVLRRDRAVVVAGLVTITCLAWAYTVHLTRNMSGMDISMSMPDVQVWGTMDFVLTFAMWAAMQVAMMAPSTAPMVLTFAKLSRGRHEGQSPFLDTEVFLLGYLIVWAGFSAVATLVQWGLDSVGLLSPMMVANNPVFGGALLIATGAFQFSSLKQACLSHCRSPLGFFMTEWREGTRGALTMGFRHGILCVACCWLLMGLMFVAGVMNLLWAAALTVYVLMEKVGPGGHRISRVAGLLSIGWGAWMVVGALL